VVSNPFTPNSTDGRFSSVRFLIANAGGAAVDLKIYNVNGVLVREVTGTGAEIDWDGKDTGGVVESGGIYLYQLSLGGAVVKKGTVVLIK
jgi:flagellar hook assembly protein FlgD